MPKKLSDMPKKTVNKSEPQFPPNREESDSRRLENRAWLRRKLAEKMLIDEQAAAVDSQLIELDERIADLADTHQQETTPIQEELAELEQAAIRRITSREDASPEEDSRRSELRRAIERANTRFREERQRIEAGRQPLLAKRDDLRMQSARMPEESQLANAEYGCPTLLLERFINSRRLAALVQREQHARRCLSRITDSGFAFSENGTESQWRAELSAVAKERAAAEAEGARITQELMDE